MQPLENDITVDLATKHPLQHGWTLWYDNPRTRTTQTTWGDHLKRVHTFNTVEEFWCLWNNIKAANELPTGSDYHLFKLGIEPKWEDKANTKGGKWLITVKESMRDSHLPQYWLDAILACIGNEFDDSEQIMGVVLSLRKTNDRICIWTQNASNRADNIEIGQKFKTLLDVTTKIQYFSHADAMASTSQKPKAFYEI